MTSERTERRFAILVSAALLGLVAWPVATGEDGFPLSNYPMFARDLSNPEVTVLHLVGRSSSQQDRPIPPRLIGTSEPMQALSTIAVAADNPAAAAELCARAARAVAEAGADWADVAAIELERATYHAVKYWKGDRAPLRAEVYARCAVAR